MSTIGLVALGLAGIFALIVATVFPEVRATALQMVTGMFIVLLALTLVALLLIAITDIDVEPFIRRAAVIQTGNRVVDFFTLLPKQYRVEEVDYENTDDDAEKEWVVFYQFDLADGRSPYAGVIYDFDRGAPPALFPYRLVPPDRDYLSESAIHLDLEDIVKVGETRSMPELFVYGEVRVPNEFGGKLSTDLTIFRHVPNTLPWEPPKDDPRRYQVIGSFRGDGGIEFNRDDRTVTVRNRAGYDRSQLAVETVYALDEGRGTYMSATNPEQLGAPISSQVIFAFGMPENILDTPYPEKLVLGFYKMLAEKQPLVDPREFLTGQALVMYDQNRLDYFGLGNTADDVTDVKIVQLSYVPEVEEFDAAKTVLGEEPRFLTVSVAFEAQVGKTTTRTPAPIQWVTTMVNGKWKIDRRL